MSTVISINTATVKEELMVCSYREMEDEKNLDLKNVARATERDIDTIDRSILTAAEELAGLCERYLDADPLTALNNALSLPATITFSFNLEARRLGIGKAGALSGALHRFLLQTSLASWYYGVRSTELGHLHKALADQAAKEIEKLLNTKTPVIQFTA